MYRTRHYCIFLFFLIAFSSVKAQICVDTSVSVRELVSDVLLGKRVKVRNMRFVGARESLAFFSDSTQSPLMAEGILLTTGNAFSAIGPNRRSGTGINNGRRGDRALREIAKGNTFDAATLEFEFMPAMDHVIFNFVFASEEYTEYVFSQFNDVFAFWISGPGIKGMKNLAIVPKNKMPITVNTVNHMVNKGNYIDNNYFDRRGKPLKERADKLDKAIVYGYEFDGLTTLLQAESQVIPGQVYKIRISIADVGDARYDSAVFLEGHSFASVPADPIRRAQLLVNDFPDIRRRWNPSPLGTDPVPVMTASNDSSGKPNSSAVDTASITFSDQPIEAQDWREVIEFKFDSYHLSPESQKALNKAVTVIQDYPSTKVIVYGHTDNAGGSGYNERLSRRRAEAVRKYLLNKGIPRTRLSLKWFGYKRPLADNDSELGRSHNRRVELRLE